MGAHRELDKELVKDFFSEFDGSQETVVLAIDALELAEDGKTTINQIFRGVHSIKSNLHMLGLRSLADLVHQLETALDSVRQGTFVYYPHLSTLIPLCLDVTRTMAEAEIADQPQRNDLANIIKSLEFITHCQESEREQAIWQAIALIDPTRVPKELLGKIQSMNTQTPVTPITALEASPEIKVKEQKIQADLDFFRKLNRTFERRSPYWAGRADRILTLALAMNEDAGNIVNRLQMTAAVFIHDLGMASFPMKLIHNADPLTAEDRKLIQTHPRIACDLLKEFQAWNEAATIAYQHQERFDGTGYPEKIVGEAIHPGARILAIADAFDAITHLRTYHDPHESTMIQGIIEINHMKGIQFCPTMVGHFNIVVRRLYQKGK